MGKLCYIFVIVKISTWTKFKTNQIIFTLCLTLFNLTIFTESKLQLRVWINYQIISK